MGRSINIVAADSDPRMREFYAELLPSLGHRVVAARSGEELVHVCRLTQPDLILTDVRMTDADGITATAHVNDERLTPVILVSTDFDQDVNERAAGNHIAACLVKPVNPQDLAMAIDLAMTRFDREQALRKEAAELRQTLEDRKVIERAKGAVMRWVGSDEPNAYRRLTRMSSKDNRNLIEVAREVNAAAEVFRGLDDLPGPDHPPRRNREDGSRQAARTGRNLGNRRRLAFAGK